MREIFAYHTGDIFNYECFWPNCPKCSREFQIQLIDTPSRLPNPALTEPLARVTPNQKLRRWKQFDLANVTQYIVGGRVIRKISVARIAQDVICHHNLEASCRNTSIGPAAAGKKRDCFQFRTSHEATTEPKTNCRSTGSTVASMRILVAYSERKHPVPDVRLSAKFLRHFAYACSEQSVIDTPSVVTHFCFYT